METNQSQVPTALQRARQLRAEADRYERGYQGEVRTGELLRRLPPTFTVLVDCRLPGSKANIDHLVVGPTGVHLIDTKTYSGRVTIGGGTLWHNRRPLRRELAAQHRYATAVRQLLPASLAATVRATLCVHDAMMQLPVLECDGVEAVCSDLIVARVVRGSARLSGGQVDEVVALLRRSLQPTDFFRREQQPPTPEAVVSPPRFAPRMQSKPVGPSLGSRPLVREARSAPSDVPAPRATGVIDRRLAAVVLSLVLLAGLSVAVGHSGDAFAALVDRAAPHPPPAPLPSPSLETPRAGWLAGRWTCQAGAWELWVAPPPGVAGEWSVDGDTWRPLLAGSGSGARVPIGPGDRVVLVRPATAGSTEMGSTTRPRSGCA